MTSYIDNVIDHIEQIMYSELTIRLNGLPNEIIEAYNIETSHMSQEEIAKLSKKLIHFISKSGELHSFIHGKLLEIIYKLNK